MAAAAAEKAKLAKIEKEKRRKQKIIDDELARLQAELAAKKAKDKLEKAAFKKKLLK